MINRLIVPVNLLLIPLTLTGILLSSNAWAQSSSTSLSGPISTVSEPLPLLLPKPNNKLSLIAGIYSFSDFGRPAEETNPKNGRLLEQKNEIFTGFMVDGGWGLQAMVVPYFYSYNAAPSTGKFTKVIPGDPSLSIIHPIYKSDRLLISGKFREYFPASDYSINRSNFEQTYYLNLALKLPHHFDLFNQLIPRYLSQQYYKAGDTTFYTEDYTTLTLSLAPWIRVGAGQHSQLEVHPATATGQTVELYPMADIMFSPTVFFGPRIRVPVFVQGSVYDAPTRVNIDQIQPEIFFQATL